MIKKEITNIIIHLVLVIILTIISYCVWNSNGLQNILKNSKSFVNNQDVIFTNEKINNIITNDINNTITHNIKINNTKDQNRKYKIILIVNKVSTMNLDDLYIIYDKKEFKLNNLQKEDDYNYYYQIQTIKLKPYEKKQLQLQIFLNKHYTQNVNKSLNYNIDII